MTKVSKQNTPKGIPTILQPLDFHQNSILLQTMPSDNFRAARPIWHGQFIYVFGGSIVDPRLSGKRVDKGTTSAAYSLNLNSGEWKQLPEMKKSRKHPAVVPLNGWNPELVFLTVVFFNSTDLTVVIPNSTVKRYRFYITTS